MEQSQIASAAVSSVYTLYGRSDWAREQHLCTDLQAYFQYLIGSVLLILTSILGNGPPEDHDRLSQDPARALARK